jgi:hypothetical protein
MKKLLSIKVNGNNRRWAFTFYGDPAYLEQWRADGLEIDIVENTIPKWINDLNLTRPWIFLQDIWNLKFLKRK